MKKLKGQKYKSKKEELIGHRKLALTVMLFGSPAVFCSHSKQSCIDLARHAGFMGDIDEDKIQEVIIVSTDSLLEI